MTNLLGSDIRKMTKWYGMKDSCIHLYGKSEVRAGRKMGHVTVLKPLSAAREESINGDIKFSLKV